MLELLVSQYAVGRGIKNRLSEFKLIQMSLNILKLTM